MTTIRTIKDDVVYRLTRQLFLFFFPMDQFIAVTGANRDEAQFYLDSHGGNVEVCPTLAYSMNDACMKAAIAEYYEANGNGTPAPTASNTTANAPALPATNSGPSASVARPAPSGFVLFHPTSYGFTFYSNCSPRIATLGSTQRDAEEDEGDEKLNYFAGGAKRSVSSVSSFPEIVPDLVACWCRIPMPSPNHRN